jgi:hypothetical protein
LSGRDCGWRSVDPAPVDADPCSVCLERRCTVAAEGSMKPFLVVFHIEEVFIICCTIWWEYTKEYASFF